MDYGLSPCGTRSVQYGEKIENRNKKIKKSAARRAFNLSKRASCDILFLSNFSQNILHRKIL